MTVPVPPHLHDALRAVLQAARDVVDHGPDQHAQGHQHRPAPGADVLGSQRLHDHHGPLHRHQHRHVDGARVRHVHHRVEVLPGDSKDIYIYTYT